MKGNNTSMQRRHYQLIAEIIAELPDDRGRLLDMRTNRPANVREIVAKHFAEHLEMTSAHFKTERFMEACGFDREYR